MSKEIWLQPILVIKVVTISVIQIKCTTRPVLAAIPSSLASIRCLIFVPSVWLQTVLVHLMTLTLLHWIPFIVLCPCNDIMGNLYSHTRICALNVTVSLWLPT